MLHFQYITELISLIRDEIQRGITALEARSQETVRCDTRLNLEVLDKLDEHALALDIVVEYFWRVEFSNVFRKLVKKDWWAELYSWRGLLFAEVSDSKFSSLLRSVGF